MAKPNAMVIEFFAALPHETDDEARAKKRVYRCAIVTYDIPRFKDKVALVLMKMGKKRIGPFRSEHTRIEDTWAFVDHDGKTTLRVVRGYKTLNVVPAAVHDATLLLARRTEPADANQAAKILENTILHPNNSRR